MNFRLQPRNTGQCQPPATQASSIDIFILFLSQFGTMEQSRGGIRIMIFTTWTTKTLNAIPIGSANPFFRHTLNRNPSIITFHHIQIGAIISPTLPGLSYFVRRQVCTIPNWVLNAFNLEFRRENFRSSKKYGFAAFVSMGLGHKEWCRRWIAGRKSGEWGVNGGLGRELWCVMVGVDWFTINRRLCFCTWNGRRIQSWEDKA